MSARSIRTTGAFLGLLAILTLLAAWLLLDGEGSRSDFVTPARASEAVRPRPTPAAPPLAEEADDERERAAAQSAESLASGDARSDTAGPRVWGRCVELASGRPLPGVEVTLVVHQQDPVTVATDAAGSFEFPSPGNTVSWAEVRRPTTWLAERPRRRLSPQQRFGEEPLVFELEASHTFRGRVVDAATGEPVPAVKVTLTEESGYADALQTDHEGLFVSEARLRRRPVTARIEDQNRSLRFPVLDKLALVERLDPELSSLFEISVSIGPTYRLAVRSAERIDPSELEVRLEELHGDGERREFERMRPQPGPAAPWVRLRRPFERIRGSQLRLIARHRSKSLVGVAEVDSATGIYPEVVAISLVAATSVSGRVLDAAGKPVEGASLCFAPLRPGNSGGSGSSGRSGESELDSANLIWGTSARNGTFRLHAVPSGGQRLRVTAGGMPPLERDIVLVGPSLELEPLVFAQASAGHVSGLLRFPPGEDNAPGASLEWRRIAGSVPREPWRSAAPRPTGTEGEWRFEIGPLASGPIEIRVRSARHSWAPAAWTGAAPADDLLFERLP